MKKIYIKYAVPTIFYIQMSTDRTVWCFQHSFYLDFLLSYCFVTTKTDWWHAAMLYHISATASTGNLSFRNCGVFKPFTYSLIILSFANLLPTVSIFALGINALQLHAQVLNRGWK